MAGSREDELPEAVNSQISLWQLCPYRLEEARARGRICRREADSMSWLSTKTTYRRDPNYEGKT
jgi:hypothetical protein